jgi:hypothetical protein
MDPPAKQLHGDILKDLATVGAGAERMGMFAEALSNYDGMRAKLHRCCVNPRALTSCWKRLREPT